MKVFINGTEVDCLAKFDWDFYAPNEVNWVYGIKMPEDFEVHLRSGRKLSGKAGDFLVLQNGGAAVHPPERFYRLYEKIGEGGRGDVCEDRPF